MPILTYATITIRETSLATLSEIFHFLKGLFMVVFLTLVKSRGGKSLLSPMRQIVICEYTNKIKIN